MKRLGTAMFLTAGALVLLPALFGLTDGASHAAPNTTNTIIDTTIGNFNAGNLDRVQLESVDDGAVALQSIGLAGGWNDTTTTGLTARFFHASTRYGTAAAGNQRIYVCGGQHDAISAPYGDCYVSDIQVGNNHQLSAWRAVSSLPNGLSGAAMVTVNNYLYVIGGFNGSLNDNAVYYAAITPSTGALSAWTRDTTNYPVGIAHTAAVVYNGNVYVVGGERNSSYTSRVYFAHPSAANGTTGAWTATTTLPYSPDNQNPDADGVTGHIATVYAESGVAKLFVVGGLTNAEGAVPYVYSAGINSNGSLTTWDRANNSSYGRNLYYNGGVAYGTVQCGGNLYVSGGLANQGAAGTDYVSTSLLTRPPDLYDAGWYDAPNLSLARYAHTMEVSDDGWLYVIDGTTSNSVPLSSIRFGQTACAASGGSSRAPAGRFTSRAIDIGQSSTLYTLSWNMSMNTSQSISATLRYRYSNSPDFAGAAWSSDIQPTHGISVTGTTNIQAPGRYIQYQVDFDHGPTEFTGTAYLNWVSIAYEGLPSPTPSPTTTGANGPNLVIRQIEAVPNGTFRLVAGRNAILRATISNIGNQPVPAGARVEVDYYTNLNRPPISSDPSQTFGSLLLNSPLPAGAETVVDASWIPASTGSLQLYGWVNKNTIVQESNYTDNVTGPLGECAYASDGESFTDVHVADYYYTPVEYLVCLGIVGGYSDHTFRPYNNTTRQQFMKMVTLGMAWPYQTPAAGNYTFTDVVPSSVFFPYVETAYAHGVVGGYACGGSTYPCDSQSRPYFRAGVNTTRAQIATILVRAKGWTLLNPSTATFTDVPAGSSSYQYVETAAAKGVLGGYNTPSRCPTGIPCFLPSANATRGQISKMVYNTIIQR